MNIAACLATADVEASHTVVTDPICEPGSLVSRSAVGRGDRAFAWKRERRACQACGEHPALFRYHGEVRADRTHRLCFQCYRSLRDSVRHLAALRRDGQSWNDAPHPAAATAPAPPGSRPALYEGLRHRRQVAQIAARHALAEAAET